jgi:hypothetical protein
MHHMRQGICTASVGKQLQPMTGSISFKQQGSGYAMTRSKIAGVSSRCPYMIVYIYKRRYKI